MVTPRDSVEAFARIHESLAHGVRCALEDFAWEDALRYAREMRNIEAEYDLETLLRVRDV